MNKVTLREWVLFLTLFPTTAVGLTLAVFFSYARIHDIDEDIQSKSLITAASIAQLTGSAVDNNSFVGLSRLANLLHRDNSDFIHAIMVFDPRNNNLVNTSERFASKTYRVPMSETRSVEFELTSIEDGYKLIYPIELQIPPKANLPAFERYYGYVLILINKEHMKINQQSMVFISLLMLMLSMMICSLFAKKLINMLSAPISDMNEVVLKIREGILSSRVKGSCEGEIELLRVGINNMAQAIEDYQQDLEENIDQATLDLRESLERFETQNVELDISRRKAQEASRVKSEFLANMSHELRTPLNGVIGFTKQILKTPLTDNQREFLLTIEGSANNLLTIINDILDFSKLDSGRMVIESIPFGFRDAIDEVVTLLSQHAHQKNLEFSVNINQNTPNSLIGDAMRIKQVIINLLGNAIKFTDKGSISLDFNYELLDESKILIKTCITDTGIGINEENQESLFEAFGQADNSITRLYGGTGLGLIIAKRLAKEMGGDVNFTSEPHKGSTFCFTFICEVNQLPIDNILEPEDLEGKRILYYEPNAHARLATTDLLLHWKMNLTSTSNIQELKERQKSDRYNFAVLSLVVTATNIDEIKSLIASVKEDIQEVHLAINNNSLSLKETFLAAGATSCISKPLLANNLVKHLSVDKRIQSSASISNVKRNKLPVKVLAVDDNAANLKLISTLLSEQVEKVVTANNGQEALQLCKKEAYSLIFMDIQMPVMDGITALKSIKEDSLNINTDIIAVTAHAMPGEKEKLLSSGFQSYMTKPIDETLLTHLIYEHSGLEQLHNGNDSISKEYLAIEKKQKENLVFNWPLALNRSGNRPELAAEMLAMLVDSLPEIRVSLVNNITLKDLATLSNIIHKLNGACCYSGVPKLEKICNHLESEIKLNAKLDQLEPEFFEMFDEIDKIIDNYDAVYKEMHFNQLLKARKN